MWAAALAMLNKIPWKYILDSSIKYWYIWAIGILLSTNVYSHHQYKHEKELLVAEQLAHKIDIKNFKDAQAKADANAKRIRDELTRKGEESAKQADANYASLLNKYNASLLRYKASQSAASRPNYSELPSTKSGDGPSASTDLPPAITISMEDAQICAINTARLQAVHDWATTLQK